MIGAFKNLFNGFVMRMIQSLALPWGPTGNMGGLAAFTSIANGTVAMVQVSPFQCCVLYFDQDVFYKFVSGGEGASTATPDDPGTAANASIEGWRKLPKGVYRRICPPDCSAVVAIGVTASGYMDVQRLPTEVGERGEW